jgi:hypothetical protein
MHNRLLQVVRSPRSLTQRPCPLMEELRSY